MNIEKTISEQAVSDILTPMLESQDRIVTEDVAPLFEQATGLDTPPASGTVTTTIEESRSVITAITRKAWTTPLTMLGGASVISYNAASYTYLRNRLQGNETCGIPDRRSEISASSPLAANLALLNDRKIGGVPEAEDGMSLIRLLLDSTTAATITEITDDNEDWTMNRALSGFSGIKKLTIKGKGYLGNKWIANMSDLEELNIPNIQGQSAFDSGSDTADMPAGISNLAKLKELHAEGFSSIAFNGNSNQYSAAIAGCPMLKKAWLGKVTNTNYPGWGGTKWVIQYCEALEELHVTGVVETNCLVRSGQNANLILLEFTAEQANSANLAWWNPTNVLQNNLQQFLSNFRKYIAKRLKGGYPIGQGPILTLSQAVHNAITAAEDDYHIREIITQKGWTISPAPN